jgi:hypothetical protein
MNDLIPILLDLPNIAVGAILGAAGGLLGFALGALRTHSRRSRAVSVTTVVGIVASIQLLHWVPDARAWLATEYVLNQLKENRLFGLILRNHPEAEPPLRSEIEKAVSDTGDTTGRQAFMRSQAATARIVNAYFPTYLPKGSDEAIYKLLTRQADVLKSFNERPKLCVGYFLGNPVFEPGDVTMEFANQETDLKAEFIESAIANQMRTYPTSDVEALVTEVMSAYIDRGYSLENMAKVDVVANLPPEEGCRIAFEFTDALLSLGPNRAPAVFRGLVLAAQQ